MSKIKLEIAGMALIGSNARDVPHELHDARRQEAAAGTKNLDHHVRSALWPRYVASTSTGKLALQDLIAAKAVEAGGDALVRQTEIGLSRSDSRPRLSALRFPVLLLAGAEDMLSTPQMQSEMVAAMPESELIIIPDAGHFVLLERPEIVATFVRRWLDNVHELSASSATA